MSTAEDTEDAEEFKPNQTKTLCVLRVLCG